ncbi:MAG: CoA ester lyase [Pseudomonadota bacterium]
MRSWLFVPGDSESKQEKAAGSEADVVILDLEDSVAAANKAEARKLVATHLGDADRESGKLLYVRINALETGLADADLDAVMASTPDGIMLPKCDSGATAARVRAMILAREREHGIRPGTTGLAVIATETAVSLFGMGTYHDAGARLSAITWGLEDLSADLEVTHVRDGHGRPVGPFALARTLTLIAARAAGAEPIDGVFTAFRNDKGLKRDCTNAVRDGFTGKLAIHPDQIATINTAFTPDSKALERARAIVEAFAAEPGAGVIGLDGEMLDRPHLLRAERLLKRADRLGLGDED